jgi:cytochrome c biogenesis protein ResB
VVLLIIILLSCLVGVILPSDIGKVAVFSSLWFNFLLVVLIINIVFCIFKRIKVLRLSQIGTTIFHISLVLLCSGVVYDQLFFLKGQFVLLRGRP